MNLKLSSKQIISILLICLFITSVAGILVTVVVKPYELYIRLIDITWPPPEDEILQSETYVDYGVPMVLEIWNPSKKTYVYHTPNSNLVDPQMEIELEEDFPVVSGYFFWIYLTTHEIKPGITVRRAAISIEVKNYNDSIPPPGTYTVWSGIVNDTVPVKSYKTVIHHNSNDSKIRFSFTPVNWGKVAPCYRKLAPVLLWTLAGGEFLALVYFCRNKGEVIALVDFKKIPKRKEY